MNAASRRKENMRNAFQVTNDRGQLSHVQMELVSPLWPLHGKITV